MIHSHKARSEKEKVLDIFQENQWFFVTLHLSQV